MGRPSKYKPEYCKLLKDHFEQGFSYESFAGAVGVSKQTLYDWEKAYPEFLDAKKDNESRSQFAWELRLMDIAKGGAGNAAAVIFGLKNRAPSSWRDLKATEISGPDGAPIAVAAQAAEWTVVDP